MGDGTVGLILDAAGIIEHGPTAIKYNNVTNMPYIRRQKHEQRNSS